MNQQVLRFKGSLMVIMEDSFKNFRTEATILNEVRLEAAIDAYAHAMRMNDLQAIKYCQVSAEMDKSPAQRMFSDAQERVKARYQAVSHMAELLGGHG